MDLSEKKLEDSVLLTGAIAVEAVLFSEAREVRRVMVDSAMDYRRLEPVRRAAKARRLELEPRGREQLDEAAGHGKHGGVIAEVGPRRFVGLADLLTYSGSERALIVMLDGVEDPFNFGQAIRSLYAAGCHGVVLRPRNWAAPAEAGAAPGAEAIIARASAGTTELMPMAVVETPEEAAAFYRERGLTVIATADRPEAESFRDAPLTDAMFLLIGGEKRGVKRSFLDQADRVIRVPYARRFDHALGTVAAVSVIGFEIARQREAAGVSGRGV